MAAGDINDALTNIPNVVLVDQTDASAAPGAGYARLEVVDGVLGVRVGTGAWVALVSLVAGLLTSLTEKATPAGTDLLLLQDEAAGSALKKVQASNLPGAGGGGLFDAYAEYTYRLAYNVAPGDYAAAAWTKYPLNTEAWDPDNLGSIASSVITLAAGTYYVAGHVTGYNLAERLRIRLRDTTNNVTLAVGDCGHVTGLITMHPWLRGRFTLAGSTNVELQYYSQNAGGGSVSMGHYNVGAEDITHAVLTIYREAA